MKKALLLLLLFVSVNIYAREDYKIYAGVETCFKKGNNKWSEWVPCETEIIFSLKDNKIILKPKANDVFMYLITGENEVFNDSKGQDVRFPMIDQNRQKGHITLRIDRNYHSQLIIEYENTLIVYHVVNPRPFENN